MSQPPTVWVIDDDQRTCSTVRNVAQVMNLGCETFSSGQRFLRAYDASQPGCIFLEIRTKDLNGLQVQRHLTSSDSASPVIFLAARAAVSIAVQAMRNGAMDFLEKPLREHELWNVLQEALQRDEYQRRVRTRQGMLQERLGRLTGEEHALMQRIADGNTNRQIAARLGVCERTIEGRRSRMMEKLEAGSLIEVLHFAAFARNFGNRAGRIDARRGRARLDTKEQVDFSFQRTPAAVSDNRL